MTLKSFVHFTYRFITTLKAFSFLPTNPDIFLNLFSKQNKIGTFYMLENKPSKEVSISVQLSTVWLFFYKMRSKTVTIATFTDKETVGVRVLKLIKL